MTEQTTIELTMLLPPEKLERLQEEAQRQQIQLPELVREVIEIYLQEIDEADFEDTPDEKIIADFKEAWHEAMTGQTRPAREVLEEIRQELEHDDES